MKCDCCNVAMNLENEGFWPDMGGLTPKQEFVVQKMVENKEDVICGDCFTNYAKSFVTADAESRVKDAWLEVVVDGKPQKLKDKWGLEKVFFKSDAGYTLLQEIQIHMKDMASLRDEHNEDADEAYEFEHDKPVERPGKKYSSWLLKFVWNDGEEEELGNVLHDSLQEDIENYLTLLEVNGATADFDLDQAKDLLDDMFKCKECDELIHIDEVEQHAKDHGQGSDFDNLTDLYVPVDAEEEMNKLNERGNYGKKIP
jgi:hypothetical protein